MIKYLYISYKINLTFLVDLKKNHLTIIITSYLENIYVLNYAFRPFLPNLAQKPLNLTKLGALNQIQKASYLGDRLRYFQNLNCFKLHSPGQIKLNSSIIVIENIKISCDPPINNRSSSRFLSRVMWRAYIRHLAMIRLCYYHDPGPVLASLDRQATFLLVRGSRWYVPSVCYSLR